MNEFETSAVLFYADYLSLKEESTPITDTCKYFYIHGVPINIQYICNQTPNFNPENKYFLQALQTYRLITEKYDEEALVSFIDDLCNVGVKGSVSAIDMLKYMHHYSDKHTRKAAFKKYYQYENNKNYTIEIVTEDGEKERIECTKYVAHECNDSKNSNK